MSWTELGYVIPRYEWQTLNLPVVGSETFRIRQSYSDRPIGYGLIGQAFSNSPLDDFVGVRKIYPVQSESRILTLSIPEDFKLQGLTTRYIVVKMHRYTRVFNFSWRVYVDVFN
jgi:hypothetical protein